MPALSQELRSKIVAQFANYPNKRAVTLPALHLVHDELRCLTHESLREIAELLELHPSEVHDTMSFYEFFKEGDKPLGQNRLWICRSISCMLRGGDEILDATCSLLSVKPGDTTADGKVTLEYAECLGGCEGAPCALLNDEHYFNIDVEQIRSIIQSL